MRNKLLLTVFTIAAVILPLAFSRAQSPAAVSSNPSLPLSDNLADSSGLITRIAFGSCAKESKPQPIWHSIADFKPELFIFLGDNIYGDTEDAATLRAKYQQLADMPGFQRLCTQNCRILATWDDHDYGKNDAGAEFPAKTISKEIFLDYFNEPTDSPRRAREGIYDAKLFGPPGRRVQVILLDTRTFRSPLQKLDTPFPPGSGHPGPYTETTDPDSTILGEEQWRWLAAQLREPAEIRLIATSIQFLSNEHHWEKWGNFPHERERMLRLINEIGASGVIMLSGDRHFAELSSMPPNRAGIASTLTYPLIDITSSALNQSKYWDNQRNEHRIGAPYFEENFGTIEIDWSSPAPTITLHIRDVQGQPMIRHDVTLSDLQPRAN